MEDDKLRSALVAVRGGRGLASLGGLVDETELLELLGTPGDPQAGIQALTAYIEKLPEPHRQLMEMSFNTKQDDRNITERRRDLIKTGAYVSDSSLRRDETKALNALISLLTAASQTSAIMQVASNDYDPPIVSVIDRTPDAKIKAHRGPDDGFEVLHVGSYRGTSIYRLHFDKPRVGDTVELIALERNLLNRLTGIRPFRLRVHFENRLVLVVDKHNLHHMQVDIHPRPDLRVVGLQNGSLAEIRQKLEIHGQLRYTYEQVAESD